MAIISKYTQVPELIVEMVIKMIDKIIMHKQSGTKRNRIIQIDIYYSSIKKLNNKKSHPKMTFFLNRVLIKTKFTLNKLDDFDDKYHREASS